MLRRVGAFLFDHFLASLLGIIAGLAYTGWLPEPSDKSMSIALAVTFGTFFCRDFIKGISPGRWVAGIMVRDYDDPSNVPSIPKLFLRNVFHVLWPVEALSMLFDSGSRRLGDKAANSVVLLNPRKARVGFRIIPIVLLTCGFIFFTFFFSFISIRQSEPYQLAVAYIEANPETHEVTGGIKEFGSFPAGNISIDGDVAEANFMVHVIGETKSVIAIVELVKINGKWQVEKCEFR